MRTRATPLLTTLLVSLLTCFAPAAHAQAQPEPEPEHPLILAAESGDLERVKALIDEGADLEIRTARSDYTRGWTPLMHAILHRHTDIVRALLDAGAEVTATYVAERVYSAQETVHAVLLAARYGNREIMDMVIEGGGDFTMQRAETDSLLHLAATNTDPELVQYLLHDLDADPNSANEQGQTPLFYASRWQRVYPSPLSTDPIPRDEEAEINRLLIMDELLSSGAQVNQFDSSGRTSLLLACSDGLYSQVQLLLNAGAETFDDPSIAIVHVQEGEYLRTHIPVCVAAARSGDRGVIPLLAEFGANLDARGLNNADLLEVAVNYANAMVIPELIEIGFDPNIADEEGRTLLMRSCLALTDTSRRRNQHRGHVPSAQALLEGGADVHATDEVGRTAMHYAAGSGVPELIQLLLEAGAEPGVKDGEGLTPLDYTGEQAPRLTRYRITADQRAIGAPIITAAVKAKSNSEPESQSAPE